MSYVDRTLGPNEQVIFRTRLSAVMFLWPVLTAIAGAVVLGLWYQSPIGQAAGGLLLAVALLHGLARYVSYISSEFAVTNLRVIIKVGVFRRRTLEVQRSKVETIAVNQSILGRIFGFGDIVVTGTGGTKEPFENIGAPLQFSRAVQTAPS